MLSPRPPTNRPNRRSSMQSGTQTFCRHRHRRRKVVSRPQKEVTLYPLLPPALVTTSTGGLSLLTPKTLLLALVSTPVTNAQTTKVPLSLNSSRIRGEHLPAFPPHVLLLTGPRRIPTTRRMPSLMIRTTHRLPGSRLPFSLLNTPGRPTSFNPPALPINPDRSQAPDQHNRICNSRSGPCSRTRMRTLCIHSTLTGAEQRRA
mmetsp:Transcript_49798/g.98143  ORF Transcript_49798/g.98143 Transcript_49798/m.98143 type:complete len:203 (-) Transcript_49798:2225-2833(-)